MPFLMRFALEPEIVTLAWIDNAFVQFPLNFYATKGITVRFKVDETSATLCTKPTARRATPRSQGFVSFHD